MASVFSDELHSYLSYLYYVLTALIFIATFLYATNEIFRFYIKFLIYCGSISFILAIIVPVMLIRPRNYKNFALALPICTYISNFLGIKWLIRGRENIEKEKACIIVANHQSLLDIFGMFYVWPMVGKCTVVVNKEILYGPLLASWLSGLIFIDKNNSKKARSIINKVVPKFKRNKMKLWIFPEGKVRNTGELHSFKKGAFYVAINAQLPILPIVYSSHYYLISESEKRFSPGCIIITTLTPISTEGLTLKDVPDLMEKTRLLMSEVFESTNQETIAFLDKKKCFVK